MEQPTPEASVLWRRIDRPGHEAARLRRRRAGWSLEGAAVFRAEESDCCLRYRVRCDERWRTRAVSVAGWLGAASVRHEIEVSPSCDWYLDGLVVPEVTGCIDVDLNFSPSTNLLPIRRLELGVGGAEAVRAAWLRFPSFRLEPLEQTYHRLDERLVHYESAGGAFVRDLRVDEHGFVVDYPGLWTAEE